MENIIDGKYCDPYYHKYFGNDNKVIIYYSSYCKKNNNLTVLRKLGNKFGQYVINLRYCDNIYYNSDQTEIYLIDDYYGNEDKLVYSSYHSTCDTCIEHKKNVKENLIIGVVIYPKGVIPKSLAVRKQKWKEFQDK